MSQRLQKQQQRGNYHTDVNVFIGSNQDMAALFCLLSSVQYFIRESYPYPLTSKEKFILACFYFLTQ